MLVREVPPPVQRISGAARARTGSSGRVVRTTAVSARKGVRLLGLRTDSAGIGAKNLVYANGRFVATQGGAGTSTAYSTDGTTWSAGGAAPRTWGDRANTVYDDVHSCWVLATQETAGTPKIARSTDNVVSWVAGGTPTLDSTFQLAYDGAGNILGVSVANTSVMYSTDGGVSWSAKTALPANMADGYYPSLAYIDGVYYVGSGTSVVYYSTDAGTSWSTLSGLSGSPTRLHKAGDLLYATHDGNNTVEQIVKDAYGVRFVSVPGYFRWVCSTLTTRFTLATIGGPFGPYAWANPDGSGWYELDWQGFSSAAGAYGRDFAYGGGRYVLGGASTSYLSWTGWEFYNLDEVTE